MLLTFYPFFVNSILMCDVWGFIFALTEFTIKGKSLYWEVYSVLSTSPLVSPCSVHLVVMSWPVKYSEMLYFNVRKITHMCYVFHIILYLLDSLRRHLRNFWPNPSKWTQGQNWKTGFVELWRGLKHPYPTSGWGTGVEQKSMHHCDIWLSLIRKHLKGIWFK